MKTEHTSGPWETPGTDGGDRVISYTDSNRKRRTLAHVYAPRTDGELNEQERDANARLIAAAPELLEALKRIATLAADGVILRGETGKPQWSLIDELKSITRAAIDKAEGRTTR
jgi:hypothetical protein